MICTHQGILAATQSLRLQFIAEFNRGHPWVSVYERGLGRDKGRAFHAEGPDAACLIREADRISKKYSVSENAAFLFMIASSGSLYR